MKIREAVTVRSNAATRTPATWSPAACSSPLTTRKSRNTAGRPTSQGLNRCRPSAP
ncbi:hypothetical protein SFR_1004 [Streptomyces sp. FR-008]|nr:hypothetical protein SFR_1004 [Streptomyces sp. FR-008]